MTQEDFAVLHPLKSVNSAPTWIEFNVGEDSLVMEFPDSGLERSDDELVKLLRLPIMDSLDILLRKAAKIKNETHNSRTSRHR